MDEVSRLRRDRQAMKWARYSRRNEKMAGHPGDVKESRSHWRHLGWLIYRKARTTHEEDRWWNGVRKTLVLFHDYR
jgi:hypothetical protein